MSTTGERIRELRLKNHLTLDDVAKHLGVGRQAIYKYEQGTVTNIPLENIEKMASLFGSTPEYIAGWAGDEFTQEYIKLLLEDKVEHDLIATYRQLSLHGKNLLLERAKELKLLYGKKSEDHSTKSVY